MPQTRKMLPSPKRWAPKPSFDGMDILCSQDGRLNVPVHVHQDSCLL